MTIPDAAIEAAAAATQRVIEGWMNYDDEDWTLIARAAIEAAMPAIREAIAQEVIDYEHGLYTQNGYGKPYIDGVETGLVQAARIVRGGTP